MKIDTDNDCLGVDPDSPLSDKFDVLVYKDGLFSSLPKEFFQDWMGRPLSVGTMHLGKCSGFGIGSVAKYDTDAQSLRVGRFVSGGLRVKFILNGQHDIRTMSSSIISFYCDGIQMNPPPQYGDTVIKNDVWIGDEVMMLGGGQIENGCVIGARSLIPPNFKSEPYGIYAGSPARLVRFRFSEKIIAALEEIAWWDQPDLANWLRLVQPCFSFDFTEDEAKTLDLLEQVKAQKASWLKIHQHL